MTATAPRISPQDAVLFLLQTEVGINAVLNREEPITFAHLPRIAAEADSLAAGLALDWLEDLTTHPNFFDSTAASVLVAEADPWLKAIENSRPRDNPFPDDLVVATVAYLPQAGRCLVVPTGGRQTNDMVMLYARAQRGDRTTLVPTALARGNLTTSTVFQACELSDTPNVDCVSSGCGGTCELETARERGALVKIACSCN